MSSIEEQASAITKKVQAHFDRIRAEAYQRGYEDAKKEKDMAQNNETPDIPTVLEECAEHLRAGRDPAQQYEINAKQNDPDGNSGWMTASSLSEVLHFAKEHYVRPKPRTYTLHVEDMPEPEYSHVFPANDPGTHSVYVHVRYPNEPTAREALEKLTRAMGGSNE